MKPMMHNLDNLMQCPVCKHKYEQSETMLVEEDDLRTTYHLTCPNCKISSLVFVTMGNNGVVSVGMLTDLEKEDVDQFYKTEPISSDQVLDLHEAMKQEEVRVSDLIN